MKTINKFLSLMMLVMGFALTACEGEKDIIIIEDTLPIKTSVMYFLGDAAPCGWNNGDPTSFTQDTEDPYVFVYEGVMNKGEMKAMLAKGSWDVPFIRPAIEGLEVGKAGIAETTFQMWAGDPDWKWRFTEAGMYKMAFNLKTWTYTIEYLGELPKDPIKLGALYMVGEAAPNGWDLGAATPLVKESEYVFTYEGPLKAGEVKFCEVKDWSAKFIRPENANEPITKTGVANNKLVYTTGPDDKWKVVDPGQYKLTFNLEKYTIKAEYLGE